MRISSLLFLGLGGAAFAGVVAYQRRQQTQRPAAVPADYAPDPTDPVQSLGEEPFNEDLGVDAVSATEIAADLDEAARELEADAIGPRAVDAAEIAITDTGDLYGVHTPPAVDRTHPDGDASFDDGQNWLEALETDAAENGADPEHELGFFDDADLDAPPHPSDRRDTPVADRGAGGPGGV